MKAFNFNKNILVTLFLLLIAVSNAGAQEKEVVLSQDSLNEQINSQEERAKHYERIVQRYRNFWNGLIPSQIKLQYAGSIGMFAVGGGWHYGHNHRVWETDLLLGFLPKNHTRTARTTLTAKQSYVPFRLNITDWVDLEPLSCGLFINTIFGEEFWGAQPSKYPKKYYGFSTKIRANVFIGQRIRFPIQSSVRNRKSSLSAYYELSTCDLYLASYATNKYIKLTDILSLCFGLKYDFF